MNHQVLRPLLAENAALLHPATLHPEEARRRTLKSGQRGLR